MIKNINKNYMAEVAKMLGVELGDKFKLEGGSDVFSLTEDGLQCDELSIISLNHILHGLLLGKFKINKLFLKPGVGEPYYTVFFDGGRKPTRIIWCNQQSDFNRYNNGLVFLTEEEARSAADKMLKALDE